MHWLSQREINTLREADKLGDKLDEVWMPQSTSSVAEMQKVLADRAKWRHEQVKEAGLDDRIGFQALYRTLRAAAMVLEAEAHVEQELEEPSVVFDQGLSDLRAAISKIKLRYSERAA